LSALRGFSAAATSLLSPDVMNICDAKVTLPLPSLMRELGVGDHSKKSARCPLHEDRHNSFSVWQKNGAWFWKCHAGCGEGDEITFLEQYKTISRGDAVKLYLEMAGVNGAAPNEPKSIVAFDWRSCVDAFTEKHVERLAKWRGYSFEFCSWLKQSGLVGMYDGCIAFPVQDRGGNVVALHYRLKNGSWRYHPQGAKVRPLVIGQLVPGDPVHSFESQWDGFDFMDKSGERSSVIITRGAQNGKLVGGLMPERSTAYVWTQNDEAGEKWQKDICANSKATVKRVKIPAQYKDLNVWTRADATEHDLLAAIIKAELIRQREKSWSDALNESVVTSGELRQLKLKQRRRLLGDWFCEGDLGFIFAFRGVGKTWFALSIARALSEGSKFGDWRAHERVKVLYVDGEMPPDLMRDRDKGLEGDTGELEFLNHQILFERTAKVLNITQADVQQAIIEYCVNAGVKVLILDNLSTVASGMRENEADSWELVNPWLLDLRRRKIAVVIVHHAGRSGEMRGTSKREDNVFWIIALDDTKKNADDKRGARFISRFTKPSRNTQEEIPAYEWHFVTEKTTGVVTMSHKQAQTADVFLELIQDGVTECAQIAQEMKVSPSTISRLAKKAIDAKQITKEGREYVLVEPTETTERA
jgi:putative DNA primase/helicase